MSTFRFNFSAENEDVVSDKNVQEPKLKKSKLEDVVANFKDIKVESCETKYSDDVEVIEYKLSEDIYVYCYNPTQIEQKLRQDKDESSVIVKATSDQSDLVPNQYEGGLTIWECGIDLATYIAGNVNLKDQRVLELGCGAGIPGLCAMYLGADAVHFQDYNSEVIEEYTIPNVTALNMETNQACEVKFFSGDWFSFATEYCPDKKYNTILTAETIYNPDNYQKLHDVFTKHLEADGSVYVAAKSNYFGVGGGTTLFQDFIESQDQFTWSVCHVISSDVPREVIQLTWKKKEKRKKKV